MDLAASHIFRCRVRLPSPSLAGAARRLADDFAGRTDLTGITPPGGVLMIRRLQAPPIQLNQRIGAVRGGGPVWERQMRERVSDAFRAAISPSESAAPPDAGAVWFADHARMYACLIRDLAAGSAADRWWWKPLLSGRYSMPASAVVLSLLMDRPSLAPAVVSQAVRMVDFERIAREWVPEQVRTLITAVLDAFRIPSETFRNAVSPEISPSTDRQAAEPGETLPTGNRPSTELSHTIDRLLPTLLVELSAALSAQPSPETAERVISAWRHDVQAEASRRDDGFTRQLSQQRHQPIARTSGNRAPTFRFDTPGERDASDRESERPMPGKTEPDSPAEVSRPEMLLGSGSAPRPAEDADLSDRTDPFNPGSAFRAYGSTPCETSLAGILYLAHVMEELELPDAFESDWHLAGDAGWWGALELIARGLMGDGDASDAIWNALAVLAEREPSEPVPSRLVDVPPFIVPGGWRSRESERPPEAALGPLCAALRGPWNAWLRHVLPHIRAALDRRLAVVPFEVPAVSELFSLSAGVFVTSTHVDVVAALDEINLAVRLAGLDRDPGWVPRAGRVIQFHFL